MRSAIEAEIRALRAASNAAIARRDIAGMRALFVDHAFVAPGASGAALGMAGFDARMAAAFADPAFAGWVRTPERVLVAGSGERAAESGRWTGRWRHPDGRDVEAAGVYQAMWVATPAGWRIRNESFIELERGAPA